MGLCNELGIFRKKKEKIFLRASDNSGYKSLVEKRSEKVKE